MNDLSGRRILVTGGCGYIGTPLTLRLLEAGAEALVYDIQWFGNHLPANPRLSVIRGDVRDFDPVLMEGIDSVVHLANVANDPCSDLDPKLSWEVNVLATMRLAEAAARAGVSQFVYASSGSVYGVKEEAEVGEDLSLVPISDYNKTKMISERVLLSYRDRFALQIIRPATVCGHSPRMRLDLSVNILTSLALKSGKITVFGGAQTRPNIHIKDMVRVYWHFLRNPHLTGIYNAGFENLSILEIAKRVQAKIDSEIEVTESRDPRSYRLSSKKLLATGFAPKFGVDDAIDELKSLWEAGELTDDDRCYNLRAMEALSPLPA